MNKPAPGLYQHQDQKLVLTPQLRQAIEILAMPTQDLHTYVANEINENPFLNGEDYGEETASIDESKVSDSADQMADESYDTDSMDFSWDAIYDAPGPTGGAAPAGEEWNWEEKAGGQEQTLHAALSEQLGYALTEPAELLIGKFLIDSVDDAGYLRADLEQVATQLKTTPSAVEDVLAVIQTFDPSGVAARSLQECLFLQLDERGLLNEGTQQVLNNLELVARGELDRLSKLSGLNGDQVQDLIKLIQTDLSPKPGLAYGGGFDNSIIPDVLVTRGPKGWQVELNSAALPKAIVDGTAGSLLGKNSQTDKYVNERVARANWLIKALAQRAQTVYRVASKLVAVQAGFFDYGVEGLAPLTLKDVATAVGVHESTVSRVTTGKYMATPRGTFELKYFFGSGVGSTGGQVGVAAVAVKDLIHKFIKAEDPAKPLSDEALVVKLKGEGVTIARRTVAKYREALGIDSSSGRRIKRA